MFDFQKYVEKMNKYIILSEKKWNANMVEQIQKVFPDYSWLLIDNKDKFSLKRLEKLSPKKIFIPHWSYIIPESIFSNFECIVFHMTDLPYGRGGSPLQNLVYRGHQRTKISALKVVKKLDAGPVYLKKDLILLGTAEEIFIRGNEIILEMIIEIIKEDIKPKKQTGEPTLFKRRTPSMSSIDKIENLNTLFDHIRMLDAEGYPKAFFENAHFKFEFTRASLKANGTIIADVRITKK